VGGIKIGPRIGQNIVKGATGPQPEKGRFWKKSPPATPSPLTPPSITPGAKEKDANPNLNRSPSPISKSNPSPNPNPDSSQTIPNGRAKGSRVPPIFPGVGPPNSYKVRPPDNYEPGGPSPGGTASKGSGAIGVGVGVNFSGEIGESSSSESSGRDRERERGGERQRFDGSNEKGNANSNFQDDKCMMS
jgi:hypothetical protein